MVQSFLIIGARAFQIKRRKKEILKCETQELLRINSGLTDRTGIQEFQELIQTVLEETDQTLDSNLTWNAFETLMLSLSALSVFVEAFRNVFSTCETLVSFFFRHQFSRWTRKQGEFHRPHMILQVWPCTHKQWETRFSPYSGSNGTNASALNRAAPVSRCVPPLFSSQPWMFPFWCWRSSSCCIVRAHFTARCDLCLCDRSVNVDRPSCADDCPLSDVPVWERKEHTSLTLWFIVIRQHEVWSDRHTRQVPERNIKEPNYPTSTQ